MTIDELKKHTLWVDLTAPQRSFLLAYIETNGDKLKAGRAVWKAKKDATTIDMVNRALRNPKIRKLLAVYHGADVGDAIFPLTKRELCDLLARRIRTDERSSNATFMKMAELLIHLRGWSPAVATNTPDRKPSAATGRGESIDDLVLAMERQAREE